jgi:hypothetical protein
MQMVAQASACEILQNLSAQTILSRFLEARAQSKLKRSWTAAAKHTADARRRLPERRTREITRKASQVRNVQHIEYFANGVDPPALADTRKSAAMVGVAVGTTVTCRPPHRPVLALLTHTVLTLDLGIWRRIASSDRDA